MKIDFKDIRYCLDTANYVFEQYKANVLPGDHFPRSIDDLLWLCGQYLEKSIEAKVLETPAPHDSVRGAYLKLPDRYIIVIQPNLNYCWQRFVVCKEVFHVLLDRPEYRIRDIGKHLDDIQSCFPILESEPGPTTVSEVLAEMGAMQFLYPYAARKARDCENPNYLEIATYFKIPQVMAEKYMSPSYMSNLGALVP